VGGALLGDIAPVAVNEDTLDALLARLDDEPMDDTAPSLSEGDPSLPQPLRGYLGRRLSEVQWQGVGGMRYADLGVGSSEFRTRLMRISAGTAMPRHSHDGNELTLVLSGGFSDADGHYLRGDVAVTDSSIDHRPVADPGEDCLCLAVTDAPLKLTGPFGRLLNPLFRF
jgi:putative transcriptional regulator